MPHAGRTGAVAALLGCVYLVSCGGGKGSPAAQSAGADASNHGAVAPAAPSDATLLYVGTVQMRGVDGDLWIDGETVLRREVRPGPRLITETWMVNGALVTTTLRQTDDPAVFAASDSLDGIGGTVTFTAGAPWAWTAWRYDLFIMNDEGRITGTGTLDAAGLSTRKQYLSPDGALNATLEERVQPAAGDAFEAMRKRLTGP